ncbi:hypothetical protein GDO81_020262 [Engystomops pustulosus]|uniref:Uncharacterized protein n=1 Tax=Engystomops pustulosus TaxID=76066 RepID=A0AAV6ZNA6_ENGPU|nr:hypothetical protein GDO81_020262 [Engystomops pustulosus]
MMLLDYAFSITVRGETLLSPILFFFLATRKMKRKELSQSRVTEPTTSCDESDAMLTPSLSKQEGRGGR